MSIMTDRGNWLPNQDSANWCSITATDAATGYNVQEAKCRFFQERLCERVLWLAGILAMLVGFVHWFLPDVIFLGSSLQKRLLLTVLLFAAGGAVYTYATYGFRRVLHIDFNAREITAARLSSKNQSHFKRKIQMQDLSSMFVRRSGPEQYQSSLNIRLKSQPHAVELLSGEQAELEALHERLCTDIRTVLECGPKRVQSSRREKIGAPKRHRKRVFT